IVINAVTGIAAHSYLEARDCREAYAMYKGKEHKVCPHIATAYHNAGASFMQMGRDREAFAFLGVAMEAFSVTGSGHMAQRSSSRSRLGSYIREHGFAFGTCMPSETGEGC
ncbi:hypothetical protein FOZ62_016695, partial [Perkinsus olseni]